MSKTEQENDFESLIRDVFSNPEDSPRVKIVLDLQLKELNRRERAAVESILRGDLRAKAAFLTGYSTDEVSEAYDRFMVGLRESLAKSAMQFLESNHCIAPESNEAIIEKALSNPAVFDNVSSGPIGPKAIEPEELEKLDKDFRRSERKEGVRNLILAALAILLIKTLINPSSQMLLPVVADSGPREGCVVGFRYIEKTWWGFRKQTFDAIRFAAEKRPQYYDFDDNKWLDISSEAYADAEDDEVDPYEPVEYYR